MHRRPGTCGGKTRPKRPSRARSSRGGAFGGPWRGSWSASDISSLLTDTPHLSASGRVVWLKSRNCSRESTGLGSVRGSGPVAAGCSGPERPQDRPVVAEPGTRPPGNLLAPPSVTRSWWPSPIHRPPGAAPNLPAGAPVLASVRTAAGGGQLTGPARHPSNTRATSWRTSSRASDRAWPLINSSS